MTSLSFKQAIILCPLLVDGKQLHRRDWRDYGMPAWRLGDIVQRRSVSDDEWREEVLLEEGFDQDLVLNYKLLLLKCLNHTRGPARGRV